MAKLPLPKLALPTLAVGKIALPIVQCAAIIGGAALGGALKSTAVPADGHDQNTHAESHAPEKPNPASGHGEEKKKPEKKAKEKKEKKSAEKRHGGGHGGGHGDAAADDSGSGFMKFSRQFVVPVIEPSGVRSLVVMDINIEVPPGMAEIIYTKEPKLRDSMLAALLSLSNKGAFDQNLLEEGNLESIRAELLGAARSVIGGDAQKVLILNITRQDV